MEHRSLPGRARRSGGTWSREWSRAKRAVVTHVYVTCDGRVSELVSCSRYLHTTASDVDGARAEAVDHGWVHDAAGDRAGGGRDFCPAHAATVDAAIEAIGE